MVRATSLSTALGLDVPGVLYDAFTGQRQPARTAYPERVAWLWPTWCMLTIWQNRGRASMARQLVAVLRNAHRIRAFAYLSLSDPRPALTDAARMIQVWRAAVRWWLAETALPTASRRGALVRSLRRRFVVSPPAGG